jgi:hypothetical protein
MSNSTVVYPEYTPSWLVENFHSLPHRSFQGNSIPPTFNLTAQTPWNEFYEVEYIQGVMYLPASIMFWCWVGMFVFFVSLCCRCCSKNGCTPAMDTDKITDPKVLTKYYNSVNGLLRAFIVLVLVIIIADNITFIGSGNLDRGYSMGQNALDFFFNTFNSMTSVGVSLETEGTLIADDVADASAGACPDAAIMIPYIQTFNNDIESYVSLVSPMGGKIDDYHSLLTDYAYKTKNGLIFSYWGAVLLVVGSFVIAVWFQAKWALKFNIVWVSSMLLVLWAVCTVEMSVLVRSTWLHTDCWW